MDEEDKMSTSRSTRTCSGRVARWREKSFAVPLPILIMLLGLQQTIYLLEAHISVLPSSSVGDGGGYVLGATVNGYLDNDDNEYEPFDKKEILVYNDVEDDNYYHYHGVHSNVSETGFDNDGIGGVDDDEVKEVLLHKDDDDDTDIPSSSSSSSAYLSFNNTNSHKDTWCPYAICRNSPSCTPCNRRYLLIVANGRSGSSTLLRMLNLLPRIRLSGENNGV